MPWWGRLESRIVVAFLLLGTICVGSFSYLVRSTVDYFEAIGDEQTRRENELFELAQPFYEAMAEAKREAFVARTRGMALQLEKVEAEARESWLQTEVESQKDLLRAEVSSKGKVGTRIEGSGAAPCKPSCLEVPVEAPVDVIEGRLELVFGVDAGLQGRYQRLGELKREMGKVALAGDTAIAERDEVERGLIVALMVASALVLSVALFTGLVLARQTTRRVSELSAVMRRVAGGELTLRAPRTGMDEIGRLSAAFNGMLDELEQTRQKVAYLQRVGVWQDVAKRIAHEIKNPLTPIQLAVQQLREKDPGADEKFSALLRDSAEIVEDEIEGLRRLVTSFSHFAKVPEVRLERISLNRLLEEFERAYGHRSERAEEQLEIRDLGESAEPCWIDGDRQLLKHVLINLVENAILSAREGSRSPIHVRISFRMQAPPGGGSARRVELRVEDNGPGISQERRERVFEPYETSRASGTGLGLSDREESDPRPRRGGFRGRE